MTAGGDELPPDTRITVEYQGNRKESYSLAHPKQNADVCCQASSERVSGDLPRVSCAAALNAPDAGVLTAIQCTLWTNGPAGVDVTATGYLPLDPELNTRMQEDENCGVKTTEAQLILGRPDGGT